MSYQYQNSKSKELSKLYGCKCTRHKFTFVNKLSNQIKIKIKVKLLSKKNGGETWWASFNVENGFNLFTPYNTGSVFGKNILISR